MNRKYTSAPIENAATLAHDFTGELVQRANVVGHKARGMLHDVRGRVVASVQEVGHGLSVVALKASHRAQEVGLMVSHRGVETVQKLSNVAKEWTVKARGWTVRNIGVVPTQRQSLRDGVDVGVTALPNV